MKDRLGIALVGAGVIGRVHAENISADPTALLVMVVDASPEAAAATAERHGVRAAEDFDAALADAAVDAVVIASPGSLHPEQVAAAARAGKAVFVEKPLATSLEAASAAAKIVREKRVPFQIGFQRRHDPAFTRARRIVTDTLGPPELFRSLTRDPTPPPDHTTIAAGAIVLDSMIHDIDAAHYFGGPIAEVYARPARLVRPDAASPDWIDTLLVSFRYRHGGLGVLETSWRTIYGYDVRAEIFGAGGRIVIEDESSTELTFAAKLGVSHDYPKNFAERFRDAYRLELHAFVRAVLTGVKPTPGLDVALEALLVAEAIIASIRTGANVKVGE
jgi:myo-inositol 2-dehydrogenase / D-chiro-inositol 1-dehydrogenase